jgi:hypothetical protein
VCGIPASPALEIQLFRKIEDDLRTLRGVHVMDFGEMALFVAAVQGGSLSAGGRALGLSAAVASNERPGASS